MHITYLILFPRFVLYTVCGRMPLPAISRRHSVFGLSCLCVRDHKLINLYSSSYVIYCVRYSTVAVCQLFNKPMMIDWLIDMFVNTYHTKHAWKFHQIYNLGAVGDKNELIRFRGQEVKGQGHDKTKYGLKSLVHKCTFPANAYGTQWFTFYFSIEYHQVLKVKC